MLKKHEETELGIVLGFGILLIATDRLISRCGVETHGVIECVANRRHVGRGEITSLLNLDFFVVVKRNSRSVGCVPTCVRGSVQGLLSVFVQCTVSAFWRGTICT